MDGVSVRRWATRILAAGALGVLTACADGSASGTSEADPPAPKPDFATYADHFAQLQQAGLGGDYARFTALLKPADPAAVLAQLNQSFRGRPFDVYTARQTDGGSAHRRLIELRSTTGRLYLYLELDEVPGGWRVAGYELGRDRAAVSAKL